MQELKLLLLEKGDSQKNLVDKANFNFSQIISFEGGPYGKIGPEGKSGNSGSSGPKGSFGFQGERGNIWTISTSGPSSPLNGDYWMNPDIENQIRIYNSGSWDLYPLNINALGIFRDFGPLQTNTGVSSKRGYFTSLPFPILNTLVLSDSDLSDGSSTANPQYSKVVISTDSGNPDRRILEFTKGDYQGTSFDLTTPHFSWNQGPTSTNGNYGLNFLSPQGIDINSQGDILIKSLLGSITLSGSDLDPSTLSEFDFNNGFSMNSYSGNIRIIPSLGTSSIIFYSDNFNFISGPSSFFSSTTVLDIQTSGTTGSQASLNLTANNSFINSFKMGNLYYKMSEIYPSTRGESTLFKATNSSNDILTISGRGDFVVDKIVYPIQAYEPSLAPVQVGTIQYFVFDPTIALNGQTDSNSFNVSRGVDFYVHRSESVGFTRGISLWTPATGGSQSYENGGWLNILEPSESFTFRIHIGRPSGSTTNGIRYIGINTSLSKNSPPGTGSEIVDLGSGNYCYSVEFTILNLSNVAGGTSGTNRWFKVLYQAYGGNLSTPECGELYTLNSF